MKPIDIVCPKCGTDTHWPVSLEAVVFGCRHCNSIAAIDDSGQLTLLPSLPKQITLTDPDWFVPGAQVFIDGLKYTVISQYCSGVSWQEWNSEDGWESGYDEYLEWYLVAENGKELWFEEADNNGYFNENEYTRLTQEHIAKVNREIDIPTQVSEVGSYIPIAFNGVDDEPIDRSTWYYKTIKSATGNITVEYQPNLPTDQWRAIKHKGIIRKLDLDRGRVLDEATLEGLRQDAKNLGFFRDIFAGATLVMLALLVWSWVGGRSKNLLYESWNFSAYQISVDSNAAQPDMFIREFGTVKLNAGKAYRFSTKCAFANKDGEIDFSIVTLKMPEGKPVNSIGASFFSESGYDDEGAWKESTLSDYFQFTVPEDGEYLIEAHLQRSYNFSPGKSGTLTISIHPVMLSRYFIIFFLLTVLSWLVLQWKWEYLAIKSQSDAPGWLLGMFGK